jgi:CRISPR-associated RAMP protein (TIGR02581 family)
MVEKPFTFEQFTNRLILEGTLTATTALRVGTGRATEPVGTDLPVIKDTRGYPFIPGSSLKGVLRSRVEQFVRAIVPGRQGACLPTSRSEEEWCISDKEIRALKERYTNDEELTKEVLKQTCLVCRVFGSRWLASKVQVRDLPVDVETWFGQFQVRDGVAIDRDTGRAAEGFLYDYEVVPAGTVFKLRIVVENADDWQLGMLFVGLRELENGHLALGGATSRGLGEAKLVINGAEWIEGRKGLLAYLRTGTGEVLDEEKLREKRMGWQKAFVDLLEEKGGGDA